MVKCNGMNHIIKDVPTTHVVKHKSYFAKLENQAEKFSRLERVRTQKKIAAHKWESACSVQQLP